ncbi:MAG: tetratricopeptide repeat protein [Actinobacteria bacterium]|nr:tetratricopeptide repeat protein [Actinomycetota bacterium]
MTLTFAVILSILLITTILIAMGIFFYTTAIKGRSKPSIRQVRAQQYITQGNFITAKDEIEQDIKDNPGDGLNYYALGVIHYSLKQFNRALKNLKQAVFIDRNNEDAWFLMGRICYERYDFDKAEKYFVKAIEINSAMIKARFGMASILFERGNIDEAADHYAKIIETDPVNANAHYNLGSCYLEKEMFKEAIKEHEIAARLDSDNAYAYYWIGYSYMQLNDKGRAVEAFAKSLDRGYEGAAEALKNLI